MNIIIVGCQNGLTRGVIKSLINSKVKFSFIGTQEIIKSVSLSKRCKAFYGIDENDLNIDSKNLLNIIRTLIKNDDENFVIPTGIRSTLYISKYAREIEGHKNHYPISDYKTLSMLNNKWDFYLFLKEHLLPTPKTILLESFDIGKTNNLLFPVITKPLDSENSNNVIRSDNQNELLKEVKRVNIPLLAQEFIQGYDINLGIFSVNGEIKAWTINRRTNKGLVFDNNKEILKIGEKIVKTLHYSGLIHFDLRFNEQNGTTVILECNPRVWGSMLHSAYAGVNFIELAINHQNADFYFSEIESGTISLNKNSLMKKLFKLSLSRRDFHSISIQSKLFIRDPFYEINFFKHNK